MIRDHSSRRHDTRTVGWPPRVTTDVLQLTPLTAVTAHTVGWPPRAATDRTPPPPPRHSRQVLHAARSKRRRAKYIRTAVLLHADGVHLLVSERTRLTCQ
jgi:hypothetical protein